MVDCEKAKPGYQIINDPVSKSRKVFKCDALKTDGGTEVTGCTKCQIDMAVNKNRCIGCAAGKYLKHTPADAAAQPPVVEAWECLDCTTSDCAFCPGNKCKRCKDTHWEDLSAGALKCTSCAAGVMNCGSVTQGQTTTPRKCDAMKGCDSCAASHSLVSNPAGKNKNRMTCKDCGAITADCIQCTKTKCLVCGNEKALS